MINLKKNDPVADTIKGIMEKELVGNQKKLDKNHNGKLDSQDFKMLRGQKKASEEVESVEENAFDYKSPRQPEPNGGSGVKKGTRYGGSKQKEKPEQEEPKEKKEETSYFKERLIERAMLKMVAKKAFKALTGGSDEDQRKDLQRKMGVPQTGQKPTQKEEVEQIDELSKSTLGSYVKGASRDVGVSRKLSADFENKADKSRNASTKTANSSISKRFNDIAKKRQAGIGQAVERLTKEENELDEVAPPGFEGTVKAMKKYKKIDNPFALAWSMKNKGYKSHKKADGSDK